MVLTVRDLMFARKKTETRAREGERWLNGERDERMFNGRRERAQGQERAQRRERAQWFDGVRA